MAAILIPHHTSKPTPAPRSRLAQNAGGATTSTVRRAATASQRSRTYMMRRAGAVVVLVVALAGLWTIAAAALSVLTPDATADLTPAAQAQLTKTYVVQPGDTLWSIAATIDTDGDLRDTVDRLASSNGGSSVEAGDRIIVPAE